MLMRESRSEVAGATQPALRHNDTKRYLREVHKLRSAMAVSDVGEVKVVRIEGKLDTQTWPDAEARLTQLIDQGATKLVVNLEKLDYVSSAGLDVLLKAARQLKGNSGALRICSLNELVQKVFDISGFTTILTVTKTEPEALEGF